MADCTRSSKLNARFHSREWMVDCEILCGWVCIRVRRPRSVSSRHKQDDGIATMGEGGWSSRAGSFDHSGHEGRGSNGTISVTAAIMLQESVKLDQHRGCTTGSPLRRGSVFWGAERRVGGRRCEFAQAGRSMQRRLFGSRVISGVKRGTQDKPTKWRAKHCSFVIPRVAFVGRMAGG